MNESSRSAIRRWKKDLHPHSIVVGVTTVILIALIGALTASASSGGIEGSQGTNVALPTTDSAVTIKGSSALGSSSPFAGLSISVNQTNHLSNQALSVTWSGGTPTNSDLLPTGLFDDNYLQIFECWGPDDHSNPLNPGPAPTGCEFGANQLNNSLIGRSDGGSGPIARQIASNDPSTYAFTDPGGAGTYIPFQPPDGSAAVNVQVGQSDNPSEPGVVWKNQYFDYTTTNEVDYGRTYKDGTGSVLFTVDTGLEAPGLGCGQQVQLPNGSSKSPQCWLVIVPRGSPMSENPSGGSKLFIQTSPLSGQAYSHRIAIPLQFNPIGAGCQLSSSQDLIAGGELAAPAVNNWELTLCASANSPPYQFTAISEDQARQELGTTGPGAPGMAVVSQPLDPSQLAADDPATYAPLTLSGVVVGFNVDRQLNANTHDQAESDLVGQNIQNIYLTPRLVAKLLTESYVQSFVGLNPNQAAAGYEWIKKNPYSLLADPDFLQFNPEFSLLTCQAAATDCAGPIVEEPAADATSELWRWILADPEAKAWLDGKSDQWGMQVNPHYSTSAGLNPTGNGFAAGAIPNTFPKADPYTFQDQTQLVNANNQLPRALGMGDFLPYAGSLQAAALATRSANDGAKLSLNTGALSTNLAWTANGPQPIGAAFELSVTDTADAAQFGLQAASLSRAGDDSATRTFVAPDTAGLLAGEAAMVPSSVAGVLQPDPKTNAAGAYPLAMLTYAAVAAPRLSASLCKDLSAFITYGVGAGQVSGNAPGELPVGYAPLSSSLRAQSQTAASQIVSKCGTAGASTGSSSPSSGNAGPTATSAPPTISTTSSGAPPLIAPSTTSTSMPSVASRPVTGHIETVEAPKPVGRTPGVGLGTGRYLIPILAGIGFLGVLAARWVDVWTRRVRRRIVR